MSELEQSTTDLVSLVTLVVVPKQLQMLILEGRFSSGLLVMHMMLCVLYMLERVLYSPSYPRQNPLQLQKNHKFSTSLLVLQSRRIQNLTLEKVLYLHLFLLQKQLSSRALHLDCSRFMVLVSRRIPRTMLVKVPCSDLFPSQRQLLFNLYNRHYSDLQVQLQTSMSGSINLVLVHSLHSVEPHITKELHSIITKTLLLMLDMRIMV